MERTERQAHWEHVYVTKGENEVSWFQQSPAPSLELIAQVGATRRSAIVDIGGTKFTMFTDKDSAWIENPSQETDLIAAMQKGTRMTVVGKSRRGTITT